MLLCDDCPVFTIMDVSSSCILTEGGTVLLTMLEAGGLRELLFRLPMRLAKTGGSLALSPEPGCDIVSIGST